MTRDKVLFSIKRLKTIHQVDLTLRLNEQFGTLSELNRYYFSYICHNAGPESTCQSQPCQNEGTCSESEVSTYTCHCVHGYHGIHCESKINNILFEWHELVPFCFMSRQD